MSDEFKFNSNQWHSRGYLPHYETHEKYQFITYRLDDALPKTNITQELINETPSTPTSSKSLLETPEITAQNQQNITPLEAPHVLSKNDQNINLLGAPQSLAASKNNTQHRKYIEDSLDHGYGSCILSNPAIAQEIISGWSYFDKKRYDLIAYVVMPNHVHLLIKAYDKWPLGALVHSWKQHATTFIKNHADIWKTYEQSWHNIHSKAARDCGAPSKRPHIWQREYWDRFIRDENHFKKTVDYIHLNPVKSGLVQQPQQWTYSSYNNLESKSS